MQRISCRACHSSSGDVVLDLGDQPPADFFPRVDDPRPDPVYPLQMWLCATCGLAQLVEDPTLPEEPLAVEPAALAAQAADAVERVADSGYLGAGLSVTEYASPHGGSWLDLLCARGLVPATRDEPADVLIDCFGMMHAADQAGAVARRGSRLGDGGVMFLQYHSLETIVRRGQWNALRHGHFAYYSTTALVAMLARAGFAPREAWEFDLYGGTVLLAAVRAEDGNSVDASVQTILERERCAGVADPAIVGGLQDAMQRHGERLRDWLVAARASGRRILGYGAASRAVALLVRAGVDASLLPAVVDASPGKVGRRMPGTDIPVVDPSYLRCRPDDVVVFVSDLLPEVAVSFPDVEAAGGRWVDVDELG